jgi:hypothetical protein
LRHGKLETTKEDHGFVRIRNADDGTLLVENAQYQHTRNFHQREALIPLLMTAITENLPSQVSLAQTPVEQGDPIGLAAREDGSTAADVLSGAIPDPQDSDSSTKASSDSVAA